MQHSYRVEAILDMDMKQPIQFFRTVPIEVGFGREKTFLTFYSANHDIDSGTRMFTLPTDTLKLMVWTEKGEILWKQELHKGNIPGGAFCNFWACDLNGDGFDEIYFTYNRDELHPFCVPAYCMRVLDGRDGSLMLDHEWPFEGPEEPLGRIFRRRILSGFVRGEQVLIRIQGCYTDIYVKAFNSDMSLRWERLISKDDPGGRASHCFPICDVNDDGVDEFFLGERCVSMDTGKDVFCADIDRWNGHSDMLQPIRHPDTGNWYLYVNREQPDHIPTRVNLYDAMGQKIWGRVDRGHIHKGWVGRVGPNGELIATACEIGGQTKTKTERLYTGVKEYSFDAWSGAPTTLPFSIFDSAPIDLDGDTLHEVIQGITGGNARVVGRDGAVLAELGGKVCITNHILDRPGEQIFCYYDDGHIRIWSDRNAEDSPEALKRYEHHFYRMNQKFPSYDYIMCMFGGI